MDRGHAHQAPRFALPGKKALLKSDIKYEVVLIDATETPIERPKKELGIKSPSRTVITSKNIGIQEKRKDTP